MTTLLAPESTAALILGAHDWTEAGMGRSPSFLRSARGILSYLIDSAGLNLDATLVVDLFDDPASAGEQLARARETLDTLLRERRDEGAPITDLLVYYVGHGHTDDQGHLSLLVRRSRRGMETETSIRTPDLARVLRIAAPQQRRIVILDCCFSEAAARDFMGMSASLDQAVAASAAKDLRDHEPRRGTLLLCSSPIGEVSMAPPTATRTLFTGSVLEVLRGGAPGFPAELSLADLRDAAHERMVLSFGANAPRPVLHQVNSADGDLTRAAAFPNRDKSADQQRVEREAAEKAKQERSERARAKRLALEEVRRRQAAEQAERAQAARVEREEAERQAADEQRARLEEAVRLAAEAERAKAVRLSAEQARQERAAKAQLERRQRAAAEKAERERAERAAAEEASRTRAEQVERDEAERQAAAVQRAQLEEAVRLAAEAERARAVRLSAEQARLERVAKAQREHDERAATEKAEHERARQEAALKADQERTEREATWTAEQEAARRAKEKRAEREAIRKSHQEKDRRDAARQAEQERAQRAAAEEESKRRRQAIIFLTSPLLLVAMIFFVVTGLDVVAPSSSNEQSQRIDPVPGRAVFEAPPPAEGPINKLSADPDQPSQSEPDEQVAVAVPRPAGSTTSKTDKPPARAETRPTASPQRPRPEARQFIVYFPFDQNDLTPEAKTVIDQAAEYALLGDASRIVVVGHSDTSSTTANSVATFKRRAIAIADRLVQQGVRSDLVEIDWRGEEEPAVPTGDGVPEPLNRRATVDVNF